MESTSDADGTKIAIGARSAIVNDVENVAKHQASAEENPTKKSTKTDAVNVATNVAKSKTGAANAPENKNVYVEASCFEGSSKRPEAKEQWVFRDDLHVFFFVCFVWRF